jgi:hypothetical protein
MKKIVLILMAILIVAMPFAVFAQDEETIADAIDKLLGHWKRNFASPSYGLSFFQARVEGGNYGVLTDENRKFFVPAMDLRIFRGVNVSKRGGFYTGIETGVLIFVNPTEESRFYDKPFYWPDKGSNPPLSFDAKMNGGLVFLMAKYGLRADIGIALIGVSVGLEAGAGGTLFAGGYEFYTGPPDDPIVKVGSGSANAILGLIVDLNGEGAIRLGKNFRFFLKAGFVIAPIGLPENRWDEYEWIAQEDQSTGYPSPNISPEDRQRYLLSQYRLELEPFGFGARVGFALNFD